ncbi:MAG TPA: hypothetical protein VE641_05785 [Chthoniobacterales bacterium]|nr:hypothetical protein [Chthoniobacterales bacterium]
MPSIATNNTFTPDGIGLLRVYAAATLYETSGTNVFGARRQPPRAKRCDLRGDGFHRKNQEHAGSVGVA